MLEEELLEIYVDGSISQNNSSGGIAIRILTIDSNGNEVPYDFQSAGYPNAKSGQIEIIACTYALEEVIRSRLVYGKRHVIIFTDSKYVAENYKAAMFQWANNRWLWKSGRPVLDASEWRELIKQILIHTRSGRYVEIKWIKGHSNNQHNQAVHKKAKDASRLPVGSLPKNRVISVFRPKKNIAPAKLVIGCVKMDGQRLSIKILECEYLKQQHFWSYKYLVFSKNSTYYGMVDKAFSKISLHAGKSYYVKCNKNTNNPQIEKMYWEIL